MAMRSLGLRGKLRNRTEPAFPVCGEETLDLLQRASCTKTMFRRGVGVVPYHASLVGAESAESCHAKFQWDSRDLVLHYDSVRVCPAASDRKLVPDLHPSDQELIRVVRIAGGVVGLSRGN